MNIKLKAWFTDQNIWKYLIPLGIILLNFILKIIYLSESAISNDEPFSIYHALMDVPSIIYQLSLGNNPPLFEIILHYWIKIFGISPFSVRFLPMIFSVLTAYVIYKIGIRFFNKQIAIIASLLFTFSTVQYVFVHQARVYTLFVLLASLSIYAFLYLYQNPNKKISIFYLFLWNILLIYSHYFGIWIPVIETVVFIFIPTVRKKIVKPFLIAFAAIILTYLPFISVFLKQFFGSASSGTWVQPVDFKDIFIQYYHFFNGQVAAIIAAILLLYYLILSINKKEVINIYSIITGSFFIIPFTIMFIISLKYMPHPIPVFIERYIFFTTPALYLITAKAIDYCCKSTQIKAIISAIVIFFFLLTFNPHKAETWTTKEEVEIVKQYKTPETIVYFTPPWYSLNFAYHYDKAIFSDINTTTILKNINEGLEKQLIFPIADYSNIDTSLFNNATKLICIDTNKAWESTSNDIRNNISAHFSKTSTILMKNGFHKVIIFEK
jgi:uncharacterized membrane protein